jgi:hypothetical protein
MAKIINKKLTWTASDSTDVVGHNVYIRTGINTLTYDDLKLYVVMPTVEVSLPDGFPGFPLFDGDFMIGISAVDDWGNESDIVSIARPFDFIAPNVPTNLNIV